MSLVKLKILLGDDSKTSNPQPTSKPDSRADNESHDSSPANTTAGKKRRGRPRKSAHTSQQEQGDD